MQQRQEIRTLASRLLYYLDTFERSQRTGIDIKLLINIEIVGVSPTGLHQDDRKSSYTCGT